MNLNALLHLTTLARIYRAMRDALRQRCTAYVRNAKRKVSIVVCYLTGDQAWQVLGVSSGFQYFDAKGRDITAMVLTALRGAQ